MKTTNFFATSLLRQRLIQGYIMSQTQPITPDNTNYVQLGMDSPPRVFAERHQTRTLENLYFEKLRELALLEAKHDELVQDFHALRHVARNTHRQNQELQRKVGKQQHQLSKVRMAVRNIRVVKLGPLDRALDLLQGEAGYQSE